MGQLAMNWVSKYSFTSFTVSLIEIKSVSVVLFYHHSYLDYLDDRFFEVQVRFGWLNRSNTFSLGLGSGCRI